jgi:hypothetical protein
VAECDGECVGGVGRSWRLVQIEEGLDHHRDLVFATAAVGGDELLDLAGLVEGGRKAGLCSGEQGHGARFADSDGGAYVPDYEVLDGDLVGAGFSDDVGEGFVDAEEALGDGSLGGWRDGPEVEGFVAVAVGAKQAVAGAGEGGVDAEDGEL